MRGVGPIARTRILRPPCHWRFLFTDGDFSSREPSAARGRGKPFIERGCLARFRRVRLKVLTLREAIADAEPARRWLALARLMTLSYRLHDADDIARYLWRHVKRLRESFVSRDW